MRKRTILIAAAVVIAAGGGVAAYLLFFASPPAVHQDRTARQWAEQLTSDSVDARIEACKALAALGAAADGTVDELVEMMNEERSRRVRKAAAKALSSIGPPAVPAMRLWLKARDAGTRAEACDILADMGPKARTATAALMWIMRGDKDAQIRSSAAVALGKVGKPAVGTLADGLDDSDPNTREYAAWALGRMGETAADAADELLETLRDDDDKVRYRVVWALLRMKRAALTDGAVAALAKSLTDDSAAVRKTAAMTLGGFGPDAADAIGALIRSFEDAKESVQSAAADAINKIGPKAIPALIEALTRPDDNVRALSAGCIVAMGPKDGIPPMEKMLRQCRPEHRRLAAVVLRQFGRDAIAAFCRVLDHDDPAVCQIAAEVLGRHYSTGALAALIHTLKDPNPRRRQWAEKIIEGIGPMAVKALEAAADDPQIADVVARLLKKIQAPASQAAQGQAG